MKISKVKKGKIAELLVQLVALKQGLDVYEEVNGDTKIDLIIRDPKTSKSYTCQVKCITSSEAAEGRKLPVRKLTHSKTAHKTHHYSSKNIDFFIGVDIENDEVFILDMKFVETYRSSISLDIVKEKSYSNFPIMEPIVGNGDSVQPKFGEPLTGDPEPKAAKAVNGVETRRVAPKSKRQGEEIVQTTNDKTAVKAEVVRKTDVRVSKA